MLSTSNVLTLPYMELLEELGKMALVELPQGGAGEPETLKRLDKLLGKVANDYAFFMYLWAYVSHQTSLKKRGGDTEGWNEATKRKETLYELAQAMKLKWQAVSRMLTVAIKGDGEEDEGVPHHRNYNPPKPPPSSTPFGEQDWEKAARTGETPAKKPSMPTSVQRAVTKTTGGWGSVPKK